MRSQNLHIPAEEEEVGVEVGVVAVVVQIKLSIKRSVHMSSLKMILKH